jgi:hypothetical protein
VVRTLPDVGLHRRAGKGARDLEGPRERLAADRERQAVGVGVQVGAPARCPARRIGEYGVAGPFVTCDDSKQLMLGGALPATHTGTQWPRIRAGITAVFSNHRERVYRLGGPDSKPIQSAGCVSGAAVDPAGGPLGGSAASSERMSMRHPVSRAASRAFWPSLPMASDSW